MIYNMKKFLRTNKWGLAGIAVGAVAGFLYWKYVGCASGTCMITSRPVNSTAYGALMGYLLFSLIKTSTPQPREEKIESEKNI